MRKLLLCRSPFSEDDLYLSFSRPPCRQAADLVARMKADAPNPADSSSGASSAKQPAPPSGWRRAVGTPSLPDVYASVPVAQRGFWRKMLAFSGPGLLVAVGYMDPGNWATDLAGGARYGYTLLSVVLISEFPGDVVAAFGR